MKKINGWVILTLFFKQVCKTGKNSLAIPFFLLPDNLADLFSRIQSPLVDSGAVGFDLFPALCSFNIFRPKRKGFALQGTGRIDGAALVQEKYAAFLLVIFQLQAVFATNTIFFNKIVEFQIQEGGNFSCLILGYLNPAIG